MSRPKTRRRVIHALLLALAAGGLVAVDNPAPRISHDASVAIASAGHLAIQSADAVTRTLRG
ncbi:hypothetical protein [Hephaestia mangrovi]|uniref:hypothetical protein n=1 Tax=Hephaestia mangrovi TaxID=2873268 RepID=UPI001CA70AD2|nr:hypothetical protein [Hephaestia mangrovi]MBY8827684.1 hypothetical protein [Hephaestia mangrovi]